ncbi:hypothetical protein [Sulfurirhabdus autotrophica]|uniref:Uncharacterized protein n=1 Tax=Sulfurirhabdus autotrophica TaxID=1706046 RepID=A0A4R3YDH4_9PROT|nr:hypothetical protein [Sulfurirhabdus autotrophica]TCV90086.1 hypothetical protein EDC63_10151 [Sulfurirhabdus autotrophica]
MARDAEVLGRACLEFARNIAQINAHGDRLEDGTEVVWDDKYAAAQLWEIIYNARLLSLTGPINGSAFHAPTRRADAHVNCVSTYPRGFFDGTK